MRATLIELRSGRRIEAIAEGIDIALIDARDPLGGAVVVVLTVIGFARRLAMMRQRHARDADAVADQIEIVLQRFVAPDVVDDQFTTQIGQVFDLRPACRIEIVRVRTLGSSEERRVGKEGVSACRSRLWAYN